MKIRIYGILFQGRVVYVGQTSQEIRLRFLKHSSNARLGSDVCRKLYDHMRRHNRDFYSHVELDVCEESEAHEKERFWINKFDTINNGLNSLSGQTHSREKLSSYSDNIPKEIVTSDGCKYSSITSASKALSDNFERGRSDIRRALKTGIKAFGVYWRYADKEFIRLEPLSTGRKGNRRNVKPVVCIETGKEWACLKDCSQELGIPYVTMQKWLAKGKSDKSTKYAHVNIRFK